MTIRNAGRRGPEYRKAVADWLRKQASDVEKIGGEYSDRMTARLFH